ncbi:zinc finger protein 341-like isoform X2 [Littorina saxatilis]|uniref:C2H2-type domain-containing protein n=1 Tax=Littorina saxatilis TaxID=31220 RepID=A0AAN9GNI0_9CAEN
MERLTTNSEGTCLTLCYQSLPGAVSHMGMDSQTSAAVTQMTLEAVSQTPLTHLGTEGSGGVTQLRIEGQGGMNVDSQAAVAVQSLLDSQQSQDTGVEEEDLFQCGRCKKQFTSLNTFFTHKQTQCLPASVATSHQQQHHQSFQQLHQVQSVGQVQGATVKTHVQASLPSSHTAFSNAICSVTQAGQPLTAYTTLPTSPLSHLPQGVVLTDDLVTFTTNLDPSTLQGSTIQMVAAPFNPRSTNSVTILSTVQPSSTFAAQASHPFQQQQQPHHQPQQHQQQAQLATFTPQHTVSATQQLAAFSAQPTTTTTLTSFSQQPLQIVSQQGPQPITITLPDKQPPAIIRRTPTKAGRKSSQSQAAANASLAADRAGAIGGARRGTRGANAVEEKRRSLQCQYCDKLFSKNFDLQQHLRAHTGEKPFQCIVCGRAFAQKSNVKKHMATHKVWPSGTSSTLPKQPPPEEMPEEDQDPPAPEEEEGEGEEEEEEEEKGVVISVCDQQQTMIKEEPDDDKTMDQVGGKDQAMKVRVVVDNSYICQYCSQKFKTFFMLKSHMVKHKSEQVYKCVMKKCGHSYKELESFLEHTKTHENEMSYRCHQCNKYFASLYDLGCHQYSHNIFPTQGIKPGPRHFQCTKCGNKYTTPEALEHHLATTSHQYPCPHCTKNFTCERFLRRHLPIHGSEGQFECVACQKRFKTEHYLKSHLLIHTGETPYPCDMCNAAFNRKDKLKRHMTIHESIKKYRCPFKSLTGCPKEFNRTDKLKSHIITHSGIKPFMCSVCGKGFSRRPHMLEHERGHKSDYRFKCDMCGRGFFRNKLFMEHKCQPGRMSEPQLFRPRRRRKIGRPRKRDFVLVEEDTLRDEVLGVEVKRHGHGTPGLRSASGIHLQSPRVAAAIASQMKGGARSRGVRSIVEVAADTRVTALKESPLDEQGEATAAAHLAQLATLNDKQLVQQVISGELDGGQVMDHFVVHLTECSDGGMVPTLHTALTPVSLQAGLAAGTLQPITIIEATPVQMTGATAMMEAGLPVVAVSQGAEVMATQVVMAASGSGGQQRQTYVTCPTQLVDFTSGDPVLQGTESLLKASAEILQTAHVEGTSLHN